MVNATRFQGNAMRWVLLLSFGLLSACSLFNKTGASVAPLPPRPDPTVAAPKPTPDQPGLPDIEDPTSPTFFKSAVGDRVLFDVDQFTLNAVAMTALDRQAQWLVNNPVYTAVIEGHADEQGTREYNLALGARRARAVQDYLVAKGVSVSRLKTLSLGKERPLEICSDESCYAKNRRAVTVLAGGTG